MPAASRRSAGWVPPRADEVSVERSDALLSLRPMARADEEDDGAPISLAEPARSPAGPSVAMLSANRSAGDPLRAAAIAAKCTADA